MPDLTPPPMSDAELWKVYNAWRKRIRTEHECETTFDLVQMAIATRDEQWRQRLEAVTQGRHGAVMVDGAIVCCNEHDREPCPQQPERRCASCPGNVTLYRIKEQG